MRLPDSPNSACVGKEMSTNATTHPCLLSMNFQIYHFLVFELMKCELFDHLNNVIRLDERQAKKIMRKILLAVQNLHENEIIHRDIKLVSLLSGSARLHFYQHSGKCAD